MYHRIFIAIFFTILAACGGTPDFLLREAAYGIIKKKLYAPSSFSPVSGKVMWSGKDNEGNPTYVMRIEYDAQNHFGAVLRDCKLVAFTDRGKRYTWNTDFAIGPCENRPTHDEAAAVRLMVEFNFE